MEIIKSKDFKISYTGISLSNLSTVESAAAIIDKDLKIVKLEKLFSMSDVKYFIDNMTGIKNNIIMVSIPENEVMLNSKWKYNSRTYDVVNLEDKIQNHDGWTNRFSTRGCEYFKELKDNGVDIFRFDVDNIKKRLGNCYSYRERTPIDCKSLQDTLRIKYNMRELPVNMLPVAQLEAILGAILARFVALGSDEFNPVIIGDYAKLPVIGI